MATFRDDAHMSVSPAVRMDARTAGVRTMSESGVGDPGAYADPCPTSPKLYNADLAPTKREGRTWNGYSIFALWANDMHNLGNYAFAMGLFVLGLGAWQILVALTLGGLVLFGLLTFSGFMGHKTGVPFPVMSRIAFGIHGAQLPAAIRGIVAIAWFGIQTYLASVVLKVLVLAMFPAAEAFDAGGFLGLSPLGWATFSVLWLIQVVIVRGGLDRIRKYESYVGPVILVTMTALAVWVFTQSGFTIVWAPENALSGVDMWWQILAGSALWIAVYSTFMLNVCDFTKGAKTPRAVVTGNLWGILINTVFFGVLVVVITGGQLAIDGQMVSSPSDIVHQIPNTFLVALVSLALVVMTIAVNLMANFVAPIFMLTNMFPRKLNFARAGVVSGIIGFVIMPWNLYDSPVVIAYFLGGLGALLGPVFGVIIADYWILRHAKINVPHLYTESVSGDYAYRKGVNGRAMWAFGPAAAISLVIALVPAFATLSPFSWFFGATIALVLYLIVADRTKDFHEVDGESIAVASTH